MLHFDDFHASIASLVQKKTVHEFVDWSKVVVIKTTYEAMHATKNAAVAPEARIVD